MQVTYVKSTTEYHEMCICEYTYIWFIYATTIYTFNCCLLSGSCQQCCLAPPMCVERRGKKREGQWENHKPLKTEGKQPEVFVVNHRLDGITGIHILQNGWPTHHFAFFSPLALPLQLLPYIYFLWRKWIAKFITLAPKKRSTYRFLSLS